MTVQGHPRSLIDFGTNRKRNLGVRLPIDPDRQ